MPELPEVETIARRLQPLLLGKVVTSIDKIHPKPLQGNQQLILDQPITEISRRAKIMRIQFSNRHNILVHLKMTGQLIYVDEKQKVGGGHPTEDWVQSLPSKHTRITLHLADVGNADLHSLLFFNDQRLFGWLKVMHDEQVVKEFSKLGPDANTEEFTFEDFKEKIKNRSLPIKQLIMDSSIVSGIGNIYACDTLNLARISPYRPGKSLSDEEIRVLYESARYIINEGIKAGGATTDGKFINIDGLAGKYQLQARVYDRKGLPCLNCGGIIVKEKLGGRGTYWCPKCQK